MSIIKTPVLNEKPVLTRNWDDKTVFYLLLPDDCIEIIMEYIIFAFNSEDKMSSYFGIQPLPPIDIYDLKPENLSDEDKKRLKLNPSIYEYNRKFGNVIQNIKYEFSYFFKYYELSKYVHIVNEDISRTTLPNILMLVRNINMKRSSELTKVPLNIKKIHELIYTPQLNTLINAYKQVKFNNLVFLEIICETDRIELPETMFPRLRTVLINFELGAESRLNLYIKCNAYYIHVTSEKNKLICYAANFFIANAITLGLENLEIHRSNIYEGHSLGIKDCDLNIRALRNLCHVKDIKFKNVTILENDKPDYKRATDQIKLLNENINDIQINIALNESDKNYLIKHYKYAISVYENLKSTTDCVLNLDSVTVLVIDANDINFVINAPNLEKLLCQCRDSFIYNSNIFNAPERYFILLNTVDFILDKLANIKQCYVAIPIKHGDISNVELRCFLPDNNIITDQISVESSETQPIITRIQTNNYSHFVDILRTKQLKTYDAKRIGIRFLTLNGFIYMFKKIFVHVNDTNIIQIEFGPIFNMPTIIYIPGEDFKSFQSKLFDFYKKCEKRLDDEKIEKIVLETEPITIDPIILEDDEDVEELRDELEMEPEELEE